MLRISVLRTHTLRVCFPSCTLCVSLHVRVGGVYPYKGVRPRCALRTWLVETTCLLRNPLSLREAQDFGILGHFWRRDLGL